MAKATFTVTYDDELVGARYMAQHLTETVEGITRIEIEEDVW